MNDAVIRNKKGVTLLECLMFATQYNSVKSLLYSVKKNNGELDECILLSGNNYSRLSTSTDKEETWSTLNKFNRYTNKRVFFSFLETVRS